MELFPLPTQHRNAILSLQPEIDGKGKSIFYWIITEGTEDTLSDVSKALSPELDDMYIDGMWI